MNATIRSPARRDSVAGPAAVALVLLAGLVVLFADQSADDAAQTPSGPIWSTSVADTSDAPVASMPVSGERERAMFRIELVVGDEIAMVTLEDTPEARAFAAMLPITMEMEDPFGQAKTGRLPAALDVEDSRPSRSYATGDLSYWSPSGKLAVVYDALGRSVPPPGLVRLGNVQTGLEDIASAGDDFTMTIRIEEEQHPCLAQSCTPPVTCGSRSARIRGSRADGRDHPGLGRLRVRLGPVALPGRESMQWPAPMGHEYAGVVEEVGGDVQTIRPGQFVVGSFWATDNTCEICRAGYQSGCVNRVPMGALGAQAELLRVPLADGTLIATPDVPADDLVPSLLSASDVLGTGWFGAVAAEAGPGKTVAVVGDGAVGLLAVLAAKQLGAERIIAMSRHESRQRLAREYGATDIVEARGEEGVAAIKELTNGLGAHSVVEAVGTQESMNQALHATRPGGHVGFVGVAHGVSLDGMDLFWSLAHLHGGPAPVRRFLPELVDLVWNREIDPGKVFDLQLPLEQAADGYQAMDQRDAIKVLLQP